jgi:hypothetical protein
LPGKDEAWKVPCATWLEPLVVAPAVPQWPALAKPPWVPRRTEKPTEQREPLPI